MTRSAEEKRRAKEQPTEPVISLPFQYRQGEPYYPPQYGASPDRTTAALGQDSYSNVYGVPPHSQAIHSTQGLLATSHMHSSKTPERTESHRLSLD